MGIKNFNKLIEKCPNINDIIVPITMKHLKGKKIAIDAPIYLYRCVMQQNRLKARMLYNANLHSHNNGKAFIESINTYPMVPLYAITAKLRGVGAIPIFVKDGKSLPIKKEERKKRKLSIKASKVRLEKSVDVVGGISKRKGDILKDNELTEKSKKEKLIEVMHDVMDVTATPKERKEFKNQILSVSQDFEDIEQALGTVQQQSLSRVYSRLANARKPDKKDYIGMEKLMEIMEVPMIQAEHEAEATCSMLARMGLVDYVATEDSDIFAFGDAFVLRQLCGNMELVDGKKIREALHLSREEFVDLAILMGCDFSEGLENIGLVNALKLIQTHSTIENIRKNKPLLKPKQNYNPEGARKVFLQDVNITDDVTSIIEKATSILSNKHFSEGKKFANEFTGVLTAPKIIASASINNKTSENK